MKLILIRHGETDWNARRMVQGITDIPLNANGKIQIDSIAKRIAAEPVAAVYTGPLSRAYDTGKAIADAAGCPVIPMKELTEINFGDWEGLEFTAISKAYPELWHIWCESPDECHVNGAETLEQVLLRSISAVRTICARHSKDATTVITTHTMPVKLIIAYYMGLPMGNIHRIRLDNCSYNAIELDDADNGKVTTLNDTSHITCQLKGRITL